MVPSEHLNGSGSGRKAALQQIERQAAFVVGDYFAIDDSVRIDLGDGSCCDIGKPVRSGPCRSVTTAEPHRLV